MPSRRFLTLGLALVSGGVVLGYLASGGLAGPSAARPAPGAEPVRVASRAASTGDLAAAGLTKATSRPRRQTVKALISSRAVRTEGGSGDFIGLTCPRRYVALSGGAVTGFNDLLISHSAPLKPTGGHRYTPRTWWVAVSNIATNPQPLPWYPVVNCVNRIRVGR